MHLILFDIDGTLVWTRGAGRAATEHAMIEVFGTCGALAAHKFGGKTDWQTLVELLHEAGISYADIEREMPAYNDAMARHLTRVIGEYDVQPCTGALDLVESLIGRDDIGVGLVTGNVSSTAPIKLCAARFDPAWFAVGAYGSEAQERDHLPALAVARAADHYGYPFAPREVIVVGDTPADVSCARHIGAVAVAVQTGFASWDELSATQPDYLLRDLTEFGSVVTS
ncbi:MAG: HAD hydrolase-like protein [Anaerolineae bacterium]|nr:HAD hydrolase-like protein [Anaerolineae bacterium]